MKGLVLHVAALLVLGGLPGAAAAQRIPLDSATLQDTLAHVIRLRDGSTLVGHIEAVTADSVRFLVEGGTLMIARASVVELRQVPRKRLHGGAYWPENPHHTRLLFMPTARPLARGEAYFSNVYLFFNSVAWGATDRLTLGVGLSAFPISDFSDNLFYLTPKLTLVDRGRSQFAVGAFLGWLGAAANEGESGSLGILYGVATTGSADNNLSAGIGVGYYGGHVSDRPVLALGGQGRITRRLSLISENWIVTDRHNDSSVLSYGVRILGENTSVDLAFLHVSDAQVFPGVPFVGFAVRF